MREMSFNLRSGVVLTLLPISAGSFTMGSPPNEIGRRVADETQHPVTITRNFWMGKYPVTQAQYQAVMGHNPSAFQTGGDHPVEQASWYDATEFCQRLNERFRRELPTGYLFRLPTEAQWEYACRAGSTTALYTGENLSGAGESRELDPIAWYVENHRETGHLPVGQKAPNAWGLYDMLGNIHEWVYDKYGPYRGSAVDPEGAATGSERVVRGGSWRSPAWRCRAARRGVDEPFYCLDGLGFRVAIVPEP